MTLLLFLGLCFLPAFVIAAFVTRVMRSNAIRWGLVDQPAARKVHETPTPLGGGVAIFLGFLIPVTAAQLLVFLMQQGHLPSDWLPSVLQAHLDGVAHRSSELWMLMFAGTVLVVMGLIDDRRGLSWKLRLTIQLAVAVCLVGSGVSATVFVSVPIVGQIVSVLWIVVLINSLNFLDNMDGLSAGIGLIASVMFAAVMLTSVGEPRWLVGGALVVLAGSLAGFLVHNWPPAKIFMGDAGSTFIGLMLASLTILGTFYDDSLPQRHVMLAPLCVLAIPLYDFTTVIVIRLWEGRSPFQPDKRHFSHRLAAIGLSRTHSVMTVHFATLTTGLGALLLYQVDNWRGALLVVALILCLLVIVAILENAGRPQPP